MYLHEHLVVGGAFALVLSGCANTRVQSDPASTPVVPLAQVIGSMKCGLARAMIDEQGGRTGLFGGVAAVVLKVNVVKGKSLKGEASVGIPIASTGTFTPGFTFARDQTLTNNTTIEFDFDLSAADTGVCNTDYAEGYDAGFSGWIGAVVSSMNAVVAGAPKVSMKSYLYDSDFVVTKAVGANGKFDITPVKGSLSYDSSRTDLQHINITIKAVHIVGGRVVASSVPFGTIPNQPSIRTAPSRVPPKQTGELPRQCKSVIGGKVRDGSVPTLEPVKCE